MHIERIGTASARRVADRQVELSARVQIDDLDWRLAAEVGLTRAEAEALEFFADIEGQVGFYYLELARLGVARDPELSAFLTTWNYEEYFHADALTRLLRSCGIASVEVTERRTAIRANARFKAKLEDLAQIALARTIPGRFTALWMVWGALQEALTTKGYEELEATTQNPVLRELCRRIAKQERRHFAFYFSQGRDRLEADRGAQRFCRFMVNRFYAPVGSGVKTDSEVARLVAQLFPGDRLLAVVRSIDDRIGELPGLAGLGACTRWATRVQPLLPAHLRVPGVTLTDAIRSTMARPSARVD